MVGIGGGGRGTLDGNFTKLPLPPLPRTHHPAGGGRSRDLSVGGFTGEDVGC